MDEYVNSRPEAMGEDDLWYSAPGKSQRMAEFSTIVSGTCVRAVESRDSLGYPVGEASAEKGPT